MEKRHLEEQLEIYLESLRFKEYSPRSITKFRSDIGKFIKSLYLEQEGKSGELTKDDVTSYKATLNNKFKTRSISSYLINLNKFLKYLGLAEFCVKTPKLQIYHSLENIITSEEYQEMLKVALNVKNTQTYYIMRTIACTGIRVSELCFITVEAVKMAKNEVRNKNKVRDVIINDDLQELLLKYCKAENIVTGCIFFCENPEKPIHASTVWRRIKRIAKIAGIPQDKAFPHNFRHLFARTYLDKYGNVIELADLLGHASLEVTRIYTRTNNAEKRDKMKNLGL